METLVPVRAVGGELADHGVVEHADLGALLDPGVAPHALDAPGLLVLVQPPDGRHAEVLEGVLGVDPVLEEDT